MQTAVTGDRETAIWASLDTPLVGSYPAAVELVDRPVEAHRAYLPAFAHEPSAVSQVVAGSASYTTGALCRCCQGSTRADG